MNNLLNYRYIINIFALFAGSFLVTSCSWIEGPIGKWHDNIKLSTKYAELSSAEDSIIITTKGDWWWIDGISFEGALFSYYHRYDINLESSSYSIRESHFTLERRNKNTLFVKLNRNSALLIRNC